MSSSAGASSSKPRIARAAPLDVASAKAQAMTLLQGFEGLKPSLQKVTLVTIERLLVSGFGSRYRTQLMLMFSQAQLSSEDDRDELALFVLEAVDSLWASSWTPVTPLLSASRSLYATSLAISSLVPSAQSEVETESVAEEEKEEGGKKKRKGKKKAVEVPAAVPVPQPPPKTTAMSLRPVPRPRAPAMLAAAASTTGTVPSVVPSAPPAAAMAPPAIPRASATAKRPRVSDPEAPSRAPPAKAAKRKGKKAATKGDTGVALEAPSELYEAVEGEPPMRFLDAAEYSARFPAKTVKFIGKHRVSLASSLDSPSLAPLIMFLVQCERCRTIGVAKECAYIQEYGGRCERCRNQRQKCKWNRDDSKAWLLVAKKYDPDLTLIVSDDEDSKDEDGKSKTCM